MSRSKLVYAVLASDSLWWRHSGLPQGSAIGSVELGTEFAGGAVTSADETDFLTDYAFSEPYADWNMDGTWTSADVDAFDAGYTYVTCPCP